MYTLIHTINKLCQAFILCTQLILRREAVCLYREFLRVSREVGGSRERDDMRRWVREEFNKWKGITDEVCRNIS